VDTTKVEPVVPTVGTSAYDEWVLDEALQETFPASDSALPTQPGSSLGLRYAGVADQAAKGKGRAP